MMHQHLKPDVLIACLVQNEDSTKHARPSDRVGLPRDASGRTLMERINGELEPLVYSHITLGQAVSPSVTTQF